MATTVTLKPSDRFPIGTEVGIYPANSRHPLGTKPSGLAEETATVDATGTLKFEGLSNNTAYQCAAQVAGAWRYIRVSTADWSAPPTGLLERIALQREAVGA